MKSPGDITIDELLSGYWLFGANTEKPSGAEIVFNPAGRIEKYNHPNERSYFIENGALHMVGEAGNTTSVFDRRVDMFGTQALLGRRGSAASHSLRLTRLPDSLAIDEVDSPLRTMFRREMFIQGWSIGKGSYGGLRMIEKQLGELSIGSYCSFADVTLAFGNHRTDCVTSYPFGTKRKAWPGYPVDIPDHYSNGPITIGNDVWVGSGAMIFSGVTIGDGAVIGSRSVVTKDIPPYAVVVGTPAAVKTYRFKEGQIEALRKIKWWDWPAHKIDAFLPLMMSSDIDAFIAAAEGSQ